MLTSVQTFKQGTQRILFQRSAIEFDVLATGEGFMFLGDMTADISLGDMSGTDVGVTFDIDMKADISLGDMSVVTNGFVSSLYQAQPVSVGNLTVEPLMQP